MGIDVLWRYISQGSRESWERGTECITREISHEVLHYDTMGESARTYGQLCDTDVKWERTILIFIAFYFNQSKRSNKQTIYFDISLWFGAMGETDNHASYPETAHLLAIAGGASTIIGAAVESFFFIAFAGFASPIFFQIGSIFFIPGLIVGIMIVYLASLLKQKPENHSTYGVMLLILSFFTFFAFGGFMVGFIATLISGIMAMTWHGEGFSYARQRNADSRSSPQPAETVCKSCSMPIPYRSTYCPHCKYPQ